MSPHPLAVGPPVFVLDESGCNSLGVIRCFGRRGIPVYLFHEKPSPLHRLSRFGRAVSCPGFGLEQPGTAEYIVDFARRFQEPPVLISTSDRAALYEMKYRGLLEPHVRSISSDQDIASKLIRKDLFYRAARKAGVPHPRTREPHSMHEVLLAAGELGFPLVLKPAISNDFVKAFGQKCFVARDKEELEYRWLTAEAKGADTVLQEFIPGDHIYMWYGYYGRDGNRKAARGYRKVRQYPPGAGSGSFVVAHDDAELISFADKLIKHIGFRGIVEPEFKFDERDKTWKILEINGRTSTQNRLPAALGADMEYLAYCDVIGIDPQSAKLDKRYAWTESHCDLATAILDPRISWHDWLESRKTRKVYAIFAWDDPVPALWKLFPAARMILSALAKRLLPRVHVSVRRMIGNSLNASVSG